MPDLLLAPYLPLSEGVTVGPWQLQPFGGLNDARPLPQALYVPVIRLLEAYTVDTAMGPLGAVVYPADGEIGPPSSAVQCGRYSGPWLPGWWLITRRWPSQRTTKIQTPATVS